MKHLVTIALLLFSAPAWADWELRSKTTQYGVPFPIGETTPVLTRSIAHYASKQKCEAAVDKLYKAALALLHLGDNSVMATEYGCVEEKKEDCLANGGSPEECMK